MAEIIWPGSRPTEAARERARSAVSRVFFAGTALAASLAGGLATADTFRFVPTVAVTEAYSDNVALLAGEFSRSGWITEVTPGIRADLTGARVKGLLDYRLASTTYSSVSSLNNTLNFLNSFVKVEAVENLFFVDARAIIDQQNRTVFGSTVNPGVSTPSANRVETTTYQVSPYIRGRLSDVAKYQLRLNETSTSVDDNVIPDTRATELVGRIASASPNAKIGWAVDATGLRLHNDVVGTIEDSRVRASFIYGVNPQIHLSLLEGYESSDFAGPPRQTTSTPGIGLEWSPSVRTQFAAVYEKRFFGDGHNVLLTHRTPRTAWRLASVRDAAVLPDQLAAGNLSSIQNLMSELLTSAIPDPDARAEAVRRRFEDAGISASSALTSNFLTARPFIFRSDIASVALLGNTNTVTLTVARREQRAFGVSLSGESGAVGGDFRQQGFSANFAHKLTPLTTMTLATTMVRTDDLTVASRHTKQNSYTLYLTSRLSPRTSAYFGVRYLDFDSSTVTDSYRENAIFGSLSIRM